MNTKKGKIEAPDLQEQLKKWCIKNKVSLSAKRKIPKWEDNPFPISTSNLYTLYREGTISESQAALLTQFFYTKKTNHG